MNVKAKKFINVQHRIMAGVLAILTVFTMNTGIFSKSMVVNAADPLNPTIYRFTCTESLQTFDIPADGWYTIDAYGASGGTSVGMGNGTHLGGKGGHVGAKYYFTQGERLYITVGNSGNGATISDSYLPIRGGYNGGGSAVSVNFGSGGGASDVRIGGTSLSDRILVAGGGGGSSFYQHGRDGGIAASGNNGIFGQGTNGSANYAGGGGGYYGGTSGSSTSQAWGGSNFINATTHQCSVLSNDGGFQDGPGEVIIVRESNYTLTLQPNGGIISNSINDVSYSYSGSTINKQFNYTGGTQAFTIPESGYYELTVVGASGGGASSGSSRGGKGGFARGTAYFEKGTVLYVNVGSMGSEGSYVAGGWNGGARASSFGTGSSGGGATDISLAWSGNSSSWNNNDHLHSRLIVAGGGGGSDNTELAGNMSDDGSGGDGGGLNGTHGLNNGTPDFNGGRAGTQTGGYAFGYGGAFDNDQDAGSGGGGWYGGYPAGYLVQDDSYNNAGGGGGSGYVYTEDTASYYPAPHSSLSSAYYLTDASMSVGYRWGNGYAVVRGLGLYQFIPTPTRDGYTFSGWNKISGNGILLSQTKFEYAEGNTILQAQWTPIEGYSQLTIDPNGGVYQNKLDNTIVRMMQGNTVDVVIPERYGYTFQTWYYSEQVPSKRGNAASWSWSSSDARGTYTFGYESEGTLTAKWDITKSKLTIDPNDGTYNGSKSVTVITDLTIESSPTVLSVPVREGYIFQYWDEISGSDGCVIDGNTWKPGTKDGYLRAVWKPITYTVHYEPNTPQGLTLTGTQPDQTHTYDQSQALATNAEYNDPTGYKIPNVKFLWWNTKPDGSGTTYTSGQVVKNLTSRQGDVITLYAQWMVTYTVEHYKENLDGSYTLANTDEYKLVPLTTWTAPLHDYPGWSKPASNPFTVGTSDTTLKFYYPLIHYKLTYDTQGGEWYEEQPDGTWISVQVPPSEYTVLTPDIHVTRPDKVGYTFLGWTGTDVNSNTLDVVIPKGSLGDRSYIAHWEAQAYDVEVPVSVLFSVGYEGTASGVFDQNGDENYTVDGHLKNNSLFPVQVTNVTLENEGDFVFTHDKTLDVTHSNIMNWRLDAQNGAEWNQYAPELEGGIDTKSNDIFWMAQNGKGSIKLNVNNAWAIHDSFDIKDAKQIGRIVWTFDIGHRNVVSRAAVQSE